MLTALLSLSAKDNASTVAIIDGEQSYTYADLLELTHQVAYEFASQGIGENSRVAFYCKNRIELVLCYLACWHLGATAVPINYRLKAKEVLNILENCPVDLLLTTQALHKPLLGKLTTPCIEFDQDSDARHFLTHCQEHSSLQAEHPFIPEAMACIHFTSGTLATPKAVVHNYAHLERYCLNLLNTLGYQEDERILVPLSLCHAFAFSWSLLAALVNKLTLILLPEFCPESILQTLQEEQVTSLSLLPSQCYALAQLASQQGKQHFSLRHCLVAGDSLPRAISEAFANVFGFHPYQGVGMTELWGYSLNTPKAHKAGSVGRVFQGYRVEIRDPAGNALSHDKVGEVWVKGDGMLSAYLNNSEETAECLQAGWFRTQDLGAMDADGYLWFYGRKKAIIIHQGSNVSPVEVENVLYQHPSVLEAAVVGLPDPILGQRIQAAVAPLPNKSLTPEELYPLLKEAIADYKIPEQIRIYESLPKNATGKIEKGVLLAELSE